MNVNNKLYSYPQTNEELIKHYNLQPHPEGGHFTVTHVSEEDVETPHEVSSSDKTRKVQSTIYYLLSMTKPSSNVKNHRSPMGYLHKNKSEIMHLHHCGRVIYTLISTTTNPPKIRQITMGEDITKGEVRQLMVKNDEWKVSEIPLEDKTWAEQQNKQEYVGGLISEVVTPAFDWHDHSYVSMEELKKLFSNDQESIQRLSQYILPSPPSFS